MNLASWPLAGGSIPSCELSSHAPGTAFLSHLWVDCSPVGAQNAETGPEDVSVSERVDRYVINDRLASEGCPMPPLDTRAQGWVLPSPRLREFVLGVSDSSPQGRAPGAGPGSATGRGVASLGHLPSRGPATFIRKEGRFPKTISWSFRDSGNSGNSPASAPVGSPNGA